MLQFWNIIWFGFIGVLILYKLFQPQIKGVFGEKLVKSYLNSLDKTKYTSINNVLLEREGKTTQIDHIVVSTYGIFVIESKNYKGIVIGNDSLEYWTQVLGRRSYKLYNPVKQNKAHINFLSNSCKSLEGLPLISIIVFTTRAELRVSSEIEVVYVKDLIKTIKKHNIEWLSDIRKEGITNQINKLNVVDKTTRTGHVNNLKKTQRGYINKIKKWVCPKCGRTLVFKTGKFGEFLGCTGYPRCNYRKSINQGV